MTTNDNIDALALQIYDKHREAIDLIIKAKPAFEAKGWSILDSAMQRHERLFRSDFDNRLHHRFYAPDLEEIPELHQGNGWTKSGRMLLFEVKYRERALVLMLGPGPEPTRRRLYELSLDPDAVPGVSMRRAQKLSGTWHTLYRKPLLGKDGPSEPDYEQGRSQVESAIASCIDQDYWPLVKRHPGNIRLAPGIPLNSITLPLSRQVPRQTKRNLYDRRNLHRLTFSGPHEPARVLAIRMENPVSKWRTFVRRPHRRQFQRQRRITHQTHGPAPGLQGSGKQPTPTSPKERHRARGLRPNSNWSPMDPFFQRKKNGRNTSRPETSWPLSRRNSPIH